MRQTNKLFISLLPLLAVVLGCSSLMPRGGNLFEGENAAKAAVAIKAKVGTAKVRVIRGEIRPNVMKLVIQSETNPKDQDEYTYERGSVSGPEPVKIHKVFADNVHHATDIDEINFLALPKTLERAKQLADPAGATIDLVSMDNQYAKTADPRLTGEEAKAWALTWRIFVEGTRSQTYFWANKNGNLNEKAY